MEPTNTSYPITTHTPNVQLTQNHQSFQLIYRSTRLRRKKTDESEPKPYKREIPSGQPRRIHAFQRSTPIQPRRDKGSHFVHHPWPAFEQPDSHQKMVAKNIFVTVC
uniref:Uncharacterized protein n=2 Tax=Arabidopsis thaliana TaxID=3702 RepID=Q1G3C6_ARATH|nr:unknown protein [Arabidopsis thaliana]